MPGRFPLFTDACVNGHLVEALIEHGWDVVRAIDVYPERTLVYWPQDDYRLWTIGELRRAFDALAEEEDPFAYPIRRLKLKVH